MEKISFFFANLGPKYCSCCGKPMAEQAESYMPECFECSEGKFAKLDV
ncbi:protein YhfH [Brevibacillus daliensis]|nr:protein YhfH [Brevibacillus daliensis]